MDTETNYPEVANHRHWMTWPFTPRSDEDVKLGEIRVFTEQLFQTLNAKFQKM